jgi:Uma2 family endonuclease
MATVVGRNPVFPVPAPVVVQDRLYRLSIDQYHEMIRTGILTASDRIEVLDGLLVSKKTKNPPHIVATGLVQDALVACVPQGWHVSVQDPVEAGTSEPEPDVKVVRGARRDYLRRRVGFGDVALVVEVSDNTLRDDRTIKKAACAGAGIPAYWIVKLIDRQVEVYTAPSGPASQPDYRHRAILGPGEYVRVVLDEMDVGRFPVADVLP